MSEEVTTPESLLEAATKPLHKLVRRRAILRKMFVDLADELGVDAKDKDLKDQIEKLQKQRQELHQSVLDFAPEEHEELLAVDKEIAKTMKDCKARIHRFPVELLRASQTIASNGAKFKVQAAKTYIEIDPKVLDAIPGLRDMRINDTPVVEERINPDVLERLIIREMVSAEAVEEFKTEHLVRAPSVSFEITDDE